MVHCEIGQKVRPNSDIAKKNGLGLNIKAYIQQTNDSLPEQAEKKNQIGSKSNYSKTFCAEFFFIFLASV